MSLRMQPIWGNNVIQGGLIWVAGNWNNAAVTVDSGSTVFIEGGANDSDLNATTLTNNGVVAWVSGHIRTGNGTQIYNNGLWDAQSDQSIGSDFGGNQSTFYNVGTFRKSASTGGSTQIETALNFLNQGTLDIEAGNVSLDQSYNFASGITEFGISSAQVYGSISVGGAVTLSGFARVNFNNGYVPANGSQFPLLTYGSRSGAFNTSQLPIGMSFNYSPSTMTLIANGITEAAWSAGGSALHGVNQITVLVGSNTTVQLVASAGGKSYVLNSVTGSGLVTLSYDPSQLPNGTYSLQLILYSSTGQLEGDFSKPTFVNNSLAWHEGTLTTNQTWGANQVNAVDQNVIIPNGVTLTIAPGAIVKFADGTGIIIQSGGTLDASGATKDLPIIFTSMEDDSVGGDSGLDGSTTLPVVGIWNGIADFGQFNTTAFVQLRYIIQTHSGTLTSSEEWTTSMEHIITGNIVIPTNVTLTIDPGAIVKFDQGLNMTVQAGGKLIAKGNTVQPIIFTSINDGSVGTDTNSLTTTPQLGDWDSVYINGGQATFDHVQMSWGGGPDSLNSGLISLIGPGSVVNVSDSILKDSLYKGIHAAYGTVNATNCLITDCDRGIQPGLSGPTTVTVVNCTLDNNNVGIWAHGGVLNIYNSIVADSATYGIIYCCGSSLAAVQYCDVWSTNGVNYSGASDQTGTHGNISADPQFVNPANYNYQLQPTSPCINAANGKIAPLTDLAGNPLYNDPAITHKTGVANSHGNYPDIGAYEFVQNAASAIDLIAASVSGPSAVTAGQTATVTWNDVNVGTDSATGPWQDTLSLVSATGTNLAASVVVAQNMVLGAGQTYAASASVTVPSGLQGNYQWQVHVNSAGTVFEGSNWTNNVATAGANTFLTDPAITVGGTSIVNQFTSAGQSAVYTLVDSGGPFVLSAQGSVPNSALSIYVGDGYVPSPSSYDEASSQFNSPNATVTVPGVGEPHLLRGGLCERAERRGRVLQPHGRLSGVPGELSLARQHREFRPGHVAGFRQRPAGKRHLRADWPRRNV